VADTDPAVLRAAWDEFPLVGAEAVLQFRTTVIGLSAGQSTTNTAHLAWTSLPGSVITAQSIHNSLSTERYYDPPSYVNIYGNSSTASIQAPAPTPVPTPVPTPTFPATK